METCPLGRSCTCQRAPAAPVLSRSGFTRRAELHPAGPAARQSLVLKDPLLHNRGGESVSGKRADDQTTRSSDPLIDLQEPPDAPSQDAEAKRGFCLARPRHRNLCICGSYFGLERCSRLQRSQRAAGEHIYVILVFFSLFSAELKHFVSGKFSSCL